MLPLIHFTTNGMDHRKPILQIGFKGGGLEESVFHLPILQIVGARGVETFKGIDTLLPPFFGGLSIIHLTQCIEYVEFYVLPDLFVIPILSLVQEIVPRNERPKKSTTEWLHCSSEDSNKRSQRPYLGMKSAMVTHLSHGARIPSSNCGTGCSLSTATVGWAR